MQHLLLTPVKEICLAGHIEVDETVSFECPTDRASCFWSGNDAKGREAAQIRIAAGAVPRQAEVSTFCRGTSKLFTTFDGDSPLDR